MHWSSAMRTWPNPATGEFLPRLERHLGVSLDASVLDKKVGSWERQGEKIRISRIEKSLLRRAVLPLAHELGYDW